ncbi:hypothetical protein [Deinococcus radiodurans]|jgi:hypothetical protein|uniref:Uncharacterized protein n=1 Tax=Deinococcus radiodurans (strain ATCC 13939 / DSM 20539 / JCM 16871 / CCUG 27074 / LMG 4051 / NBRC 15346 / NCIMB 9279 / VKM B-1422 / R1) TaxID=243230 RepID=Q9RRT3_DEIRA|nr:hypothetical protein [Deinococcus radiodurans]AAF11955.1 hypothetical protein DR_2402 [Deinococcus radiodurans R1 = ATCC 13939 = DSM 20539]ANC70554.1 hypothetical protein A2G07_01570 [Deinococcus radiodurans R1 = ATCC 13939 = DSM 20539]QEM71780.1 hypothetical protein DXG80_08365 [Deinococcus radiodurans]QIP28064.1 hypothetical protein HAV23_01690 [Deinococcus radiodurans]QIP31055.1 hypothetical protein HAV35_01820 [Deinococcus radiodurans]
MNPTINLGSGTGLVLGVVAAGLILGYGVWTGQRDAGLRAALGVLLTTLLCGLPPLLLATFPMVGFFLNGSRVGVTLRLFVLSALSLALAFLPLLVAANWLEVLRRPSAWERQ